MNPATRYGLSGPPRRRTWSLRFEMVEPDPMYEGEITVAEGPGLGIMIDWRLVDVQTECPEKPAYAGPAPPAQV